MKGEPVIGATVMVKGSTNGTITDFDGNFILNDVSSNASLIVSYVGYVTETISVNGKSSFKICDEKRMLKPLKKWLL